MRATLFISRYNYIICLVYTIFGRSLVNFFSPVHKISHEFLQSLLIVSPQLLFGLNSLSSQYTSNADLLIRTNGMSFLAPRNLYF